MALLLELDCTHVITNCEYTLTIRLIRSHASKAVSQNIMTDKQMFISMIMHKNSKGNQESVSSDQILFKSMTAYFKSSIKSNAACTISPFLTPTPKQWMYHNRKQGREHSLPYYATTDLTPHLTSQGTTLDTGLMEHITKSIRTKFFNDTMKFLSEK